MCVCVLEHHRYTRHTQASQQSDVWLLSVDPLFPSFPKLSLISRRIPSYTRHFWFSLRLTAALTGRTKYPKPQPFVLYPNKQKTIKRIAWYRSTPPPKNHLCTHSPIQSTIHFLLIDYTCVQVKIILQFLFILLKKKFSWKRNSEPQWKISFLINTFYSVNQTILALLKENSLRSSSIRIQSNLFRIRLID